MVVEDTLQLQRVRPLKEQLRELSQLLDKRFVNHADGISFTMSNFSRPLISLVRLAQLICLR